MARSTRQSTPILGVPAVQRVGGWNIKGVRGVKELVELLPIPALIAEINMPPRTAP
jgi:hypothetical protein